MYSVIWRADALDRLAETYIALDPAQRAIVASGVQSLNSKLHRDPSSVGESRQGEYRLTFIPMLAIEFRVNDVDKIVRVLRVRRTRR